MSTWPVGTVAVATVRGVKGVRVMRTDNGDWRSATGDEEGVHVFSGHEVTDVRPLVVLDFHGELVMSLPDWLRMHAESGSDLRWIADAVEAMTRALPPKSAEPGWGRRVMARTNNSEDRREFVNAYRAEHGTVWTDESGYHAAWSDLIDVVLLSEGVTP